MTKFVAKENILVQSAGKSISIRTIACVAALMALAPVAALSQTQNSISYFEYDAQGNRKKVTDPLNKISNYEYDVHNRLWKVIAPSPVAGAARPTTTLDYDALDHPWYVDDPRLKRTTYSVDGFGNRRGTNSPDTKVTTVIPHPTQNLPETETDARNQKATYVHDDIGRLKSITYATGAPIVFEYDGGLAGPLSAKGRLSKITDESGVTIYGFNPFGEVESKTQTVTADGKSLSHTVKYGYGDLGPANGKINQIIYPSGSRVVISFDTFGRPRNLSVNPMNTSATGTDTSKAIPVVLYTAYNAQGAVAGWSWGNSTSAVPNTYSRSFNLDGRIRGYTLGNTNIAGSWREVGYDAAGRIRNYWHSSKNAVVSAEALDQGFDYDALGRLTLFTSATGSQTYKYDPNGNRIQLTIGGAAYTYTIDPNSNRLMATSGPAPARTMQYDDAGNLRSDGIVTYTYSPRGRMATSTAGGVVTSYLYNGIGQRVRQKSSNESANPAGIYVYDEEGNLLGEYDTATGKPTREIIYHQGIPVAVLSYRVTGVAPNQVWATDVAYIFTDHLNTPRVIARASDNKVVWRWDSADPFGMVPPNDNPSGVGTFVFNLRMPGQYYDRATNLFYNYFRDYDPQTGRYMQSDPIGLGGGLNTYVYVGANPISNIDPNGLEIRVVGDVRGDYRKAVSYISRDPGMAAIVNRLSNSPIPYTVSINFDNEVWFDEDTNTVHWDPTSALCLKDDYRNLNGQSQSPAIGLGHELDHMANQPRGVHYKTRTKPWGTPEERRVIQGSETSLGKVLGEGIRTNHYGKNVKVRGPITRPTKCDCLN